MGGRLWPPRGWSSKGVWSRWWRASTGSRKKGAAARTDAAAVDPADGPDGHGRLVGAGGRGLRLGVPRRGDPGQPGRGKWRGGEGAVPGPFGSDDAACLGRWQPGRGVAALSEGHAELLVWTVPLRMTWWTCHAPTTTWNSYSDRIGITSDAVAVARWRPRGWWCGGRCVCPRRWRHGSAARSGAPIWHLRIWRPGKTCVPVWSVVRKYGPKAAASVTTRLHISKSLKTFWSREI